jgi:hypothetical protein
MLSVIIARFLAIFQNIMFSAQNNDKFGKRFFLNPNNTTSNLFPQSVNHSIIS